MRIGSVDVAAQLHLLIDRAAPRDWHLEVAPSTLPNSGDGVFIRGCCEAGTVLTLYAGLVFAVEDLPVMHTLVLPENEYVMARRDGVLIDGRCYGMTAKLRATACARDAAAGSASLAADAVGAELACGSKVNHPNAGTRPNVVVEPFDLLPEEHRDLHHFVPTVQFRPPAPGCPAKQTVALVSARPLRDEELFLDYKLDPNGPLESWYTPVDPEPG